VIDKKIKFDWEINIGNLITLGILVISAVGAWYDVKTDIRVNREQAQLKFETVETFMKNQIRTDRLQDEIRERTTAELRLAIKDTGGEIKQEIRDMRADFNRGTRPR
jgi:hypothetical protein